MSIKIKLKTDTRQATPVATKKYVKAQQPNTPPKADRRILDEIMVEYKSAWDALAKR